MTQSLSASQARRIALAAQGLGKRPDKRATRQGLMRTIEQLGLIQIDSVNVVSRSHYLPLFSRLGAYDRAMLEEMAWGKSPALMEYWAHEASLIPHTTQPLLRWRMEDARTGSGMWKGVARFLKERRDLIDETRSQILNRGPLAASEIDLGQKGSGGWWGWSEAKRACECLFWVGELTTVTRRGNFERIYGLPDQHLPADIVAAPTPSRADAQRALIEIASKAMGVATERDLRDYFRMTPANGRIAVRELVEAGLLEQVTVEGWREPAFLAAGVAIPRIAKGQALLSPFDNAIWFRERTERLFGVRIRLEIYTPAPKRVHGYYVLPFLEGDAITARVDLKAERKARKLLVQASHAEAETTAETPARLMAELRTMASWLGLEGVHIERSGDLSARLTKSRSSC